MPNYSDLEGKVVLLTGGANGIGAAAVRAFHEQGATVEFCDVDEKAGAKLAANLASTTFTKVDLVIERQISRWILSAAKRHGKIDVLVNNAAIDPRIPLDEITVEKLDRLFAINVRAMFLAVRDAVPRMKGGSIVNLASVTLYNSPVHMSAYVGTKGAILGATRSLARELGSKRIRVNTVSPGWIMTERQLRQFVDAKVKRLIRSSQCIPELLQPVEIAEVILFLASNASRAITGQEILADRGWTHS